MVASALSEGASKVTDAATMFRALALGSFVGLITITSGCTAINSFDDFEFPNVDGAVGDAGSPDNDAGPFVCQENERVESNACVACPEGSSNPAGDDATGDDTACACNAGTVADGMMCIPILCDVDQWVNELHLCVSCPANSTNEANDDASGVDTRCDCDEGFGGDGQTSCRFGECDTDFRVQADECVACPDNSMNAAGDLIEGPNTECECNPGTTGNGTDSCEPVQCAAMQRVENNACVACPDNSTNAANDDASGEDTECDCDVGFMGASCDPICGDGMPVAGEACDDGNTVTETVCDTYGEECVSCNDSCTAVVNLTGPFCGDGVVDSAFEACDERDDVGANPGDCLACLGLVDMRLTIRESDRSSNGSFAPSPIASADDLCDGFGEEYRAMFAHGSARRASSTAHSGDDQLDWVLEPFTAYYNAAGAHVWTTDSSALLGVRSGVPAPLLNPIVDSGNAVWTGMNTDHTTLSANLCDGWTRMVAGPELAQAGNSGQVDGRFLATGGDAVSGCEDIRPVYCAEAR